jgi:predicted metal-dependent hydrolase
MIEWLRRARTGQQPSAPAAMPLQLRVGDRVLPIELRRLRHARRMTLRLAPDGRAVRISLPPWVPEHDALAFARARSEWLAVQAARLPDVQPLAPGSVIAYRGKPVTVVWNPRAARRPQHVDSRIVIGGPEEGLGARLARWLEAEARRTLALDLAEYCTRAGRPAPRLALSRARRRWGSCAANGTIRINWRLIMAPDAVRRSVVAHEVAHLVHFDHSPAFHACLKTIFEGSVDDANAWLKRQGPGLYQPFG